MIASGQAQQKKDPYQFSQPAGRMAQGSQGQTQQQQDLASQGYVFRTAQQPAVDPNVANDASKQRPPAFQANYQQVDGSWGSQPNYGQRDAFINGINNQTAQYQSGQQQGAPQYDFGSMWGQAANDVQNGWTNPYAQQPQASPMPSMMAPGSQPPAQGPQMPGVINPMYSQAPQQSPLGGLGGQQNTFQPSPGGTISVPFGNGWEPPPMPVDDSGMMPQQPVLDGRGMIVGGPQGGNWWDNAGEAGPSYAPGYPGGLGGPPLGSPPILIAPGSPGPNPGYEPQPTSLPPAPARDKEAAKRGRMVEAYKKKYGGQEPNPVQLAAFERSKPGYRKPAPNAEYERASKIGAAQMKSGRPLTSEEVGSALGGPTASKQPANSPKSDRDMIKKYLGYEIMPGDEWKYDSLLKGWKAEEGATKKGNAVKAERDEATKKAYYG